MNMSLFRQILFTAAVAGFLGGALLTLLQNIGTVGVVPLILQAETYENAAETAAVPADATTASHEHEHSADAWAPADGVERLGYTLLTNVVMAVGFALMLAPSLGLPPEVPGTAAAPLADRQVWWWATVLATGGGIALLIYGRRIP